MSEKNTHNDIQWTKATLTIQKQHAQGAAAQQYENTSTAAIMYGDGNPQNAYASARFQAPPPPPLSHHSSQLPSPTQSMSHVPAPSGFVPPPFPSTVAMTSVLTPNPFVSNSSTTGPFGLDQFQQLNPHQQQFELSKIMNATAGTIHSPVSTGRNATSPMTDATTSQPQAAMVPIANSGGAITATITENVLNALRAATSNESSATNSSIITPLHNRAMGIGVKIPDDEKMRCIQQVVESGVGEQAKQQINHILERISTLRPVEKLLLYLRLPGETPEADPLRHPQNPLGTRSEINHTINWVRTHLEHDPQVSIPKQDVYNDYLAYCERLDIKPLSTADFGKVMKQVFPGIRPRRLGTRGHSRYCYAAMRKTTKLVPPQLPQLSITSGNGRTENVGSTDLKTSYQGEEVNESASLTESWGTIKTWAESLLSVKLENLQDLAARIKTISNSNASSSTIAAAATRTPYTGQRKYAQREPKEKRLSADMGPLKKRRKKKHKGSSSSESSCNPTAHEVLPSTLNNNSNSSIKPDVSNINISEYSTVFMGHTLKSDDEKMSINEVQVKEEILDSPTFQRVQTLITPPQLRGNAMSSNYMEQQRPTQHQMLPMNLATEQRSLSVTKTAAGETTLPSAFGPVIQTQRTNLSAVKNLTPKIMSIYSSPSVAPPAELTVDQLQIKEEIVDDYNTNIFCKKVRKAQQTKGFYANSPIQNSTIIVPTITTSAASPTNVAASSNSVIVTTNIAAGSDASNYLMGPPLSQPLIHTSTSPSSSHSDSTTPKVASRNSLFLRAKKQLITTGEATSTPDINVDKDLPENLGLPRERVISICNMDKHELDDYFLPGADEDEEESSQDQDNELLQYFQTGDAEEKLNNSSDAAKPQRNPIAAPQTIDASRVQRRNCADITIGVNTNASGTANKAAIFGSGNAALRKSFVGNASNTAVGSASASLTLMSQKHLQQQQKHQQPQHITIKRKISNSAEMSVARKNYSFLPISPNINNSHNNTISGSAAHGVFASPGLTRRPHTLGKQQSLDSSDSSDPMIGASRRRRSYINTQPIVTSASAPPSPSALQQQLCGMEQILSHTDWQQLGISSQQLNTSANGGGYNDAAAVNSAAALLNEQNSLDLDLFDSAPHTHFTQNSLALDTANAFSHHGLMPLTETHRSQSVPLSQLQRTRSPLSFNRSFQSTAFTICSDAALFSENSCSQHSNSTANIKLEDVGGNTIASDSTALLDEVDVTDFLSSPSFVTKFSNSAPAKATTTATVCSSTSSAGSSSGYSSSGGTGMGIVSRSVPSTPLPYQQQNFFGGINTQFYNRMQQENNDDLHLSPSANARSCFGATVAAKYGNNNNNNNNVNMSAASRSIYDISKSMPTTPITTPCFRYSPTEIPRDFLINGNWTSPLVGGGSTNTSDDLNSTTDVHGLHADALIDDGVDAVSLMVGATTDLLGNL